MIVSSPQPSFSPRTQLRIWIGLGLLSLLGACSKDESPTTVPRKAQTSEKVVKAVPSVFKDGGKSPFTRLTGFTFDREYEMELPEDSERASISFLPVIHGDPNGQARLELNVSRGNENISGGNYPLFRIQERPDVPSDAFAIARSWAHLEVRPKSKGPLKLKWTLSNGPAGAVAGLVGLRVESKAPAPRPPHVLLICSDAHRYDYALGEKGRALMPDLAKFSDEAAVYHQAFSNASWTLPSITSLFTGLFPRRHLTGERTRTLTADAMTEKPKLEPGEYAISWGEVYRVFRAMPDSLTTLGEVLQDANYLSLLVTSNIFYVEPGLTRKGFDWVTDARSQKGNAINFASYALMEGVPKDVPIFMTVHYFDVHQFTLWYLKERIPNANPMLIEREELIKSYEQAVRDTDGYIHDLLQKWDAEIGLANTLVVFFADHGEHLRDPGYPPINDYKPSHTEPWLLDVPLLNHGNSMDELLLHIPLVIHYPDSLGIKGEFDTQVSLVDIFPTIMDVAGIKRNDLKLDGRSIPARMKDGATTETMPIYADYQLYGPEMSSVRQGPQKLVLDHAAGTSRLTDLRMPPGDKGEFGQFADDPEAVKRLTETFDKYDEQSREQTKGLKSSLKVDIEKSLKAFENQGYGGGQSEGSSEKKSQ